MPPEPDEQTPPVVPAIVPPIIPPVEEKEQPKYLTKDDLGSAVADAVKAALQSINEEQVRASKEKEAQEKSDFKALYEETKKKADDLISKSEAADRYSKQINNTINAQIKEWPDSVKKSDPGDKDVDARLAWFDGHTDMAKELMTKKQMNLEHGGSGGGSGSKGIDKVAESYINSRYSSVRDALIGGKK